MIPWRVRHGWARFWMRFSGLGYGGRLAMGIASWGSPPFYGRRPLADLGRLGFISPSATLYHEELTIRGRVFLDDRVVIYQDRLGGPVTLASGVQLFRGTMIQTGQGGSCTIGEDTHIQPRCQLAAYKAPITIGRRVEIALGCAFYPYNHGFAPDVPIREQPLVSAGGIVIGDDAWLGVGVTVLDNVRIGSGAVISAGAVVTGDVPDGGIAMGVPARVVTNRADFAVPPGTLAPGRKGEL